MRRLLTCAGALVVAPLLSPALTLAGTALIPLAETAVISDLAGNARVLIKPGDLSSLDGRLITDYPRLHHLFKRIANGDDQQAIIDELGADVLPYTDDPFSFSYSQVYHHALYLRLKNIQTVILRTTDDALALGYLQKRKALILKEMRIG
jgi:hypothetical protein